YQLDGTLFLDHPANRQPALSYNSSAPGVQKGWKFSCIADPNSRILANNVGQPAILIGPGSVYVENVLVQAAQSATPYSAKPNAKTFVGFGYTGAGNGHQFVRCTAHGFYAGWRSTFDGQDNLSSEVTWRQCVGEANYIDVWL